MFLLDKPYVSGFLRDSALRLGLPVLDGPVARAALGAAPCLAAEADFVAALRAGAARRVYANSENALGWVARNLGFSELPRQVRLFKDKLAFRELLRPLFPGFGFRGVALDELDAVDPAGFAKPFIVKPATGFFSLGVHKVEADADWPGVVAAIRAEAGRIAGQYPEQVLGLDTFLIEENIPGEEFAVDVFWDGQGRPVILNVLAHLFPDAASVNDRVYVTSRAVVEPNLERFTRALADLGRLAGLRDFPAHVELRVDGNGAIGFIEGNPLRFAGWCVADLTWHAWGVNPYEAYLLDRHPDWDALLARRGDTVTSVVIADLAPGVDPGAVGGVDYDAFRARFARPLELRRIDWREYPVFAFLFAEHEPGALGELDAILRSDLTEFLLPAAR
jgi:hypothetical protein